MGRVRAVLAALALLPCLGSAGCSCAQTSVLVSDFEGCSGTCGWSVASGGSAKIVTTILPGEHGLQLASGTTISKSVTPTLIDSTYSLSLVGACPDGLAATVTATVPGKPSISISVTLAIDDSLDSNGQPPDYTGATYVPLVGAIDLPSGLASASVQGVTLAAATGGPCTIDVVQLIESEPCGS